MDPNHLKHDEFLVECKVRNLVGSHLTMFNTLVDALGAEVTHDVLVPNRAHEAARKKPKREIDTCARKLFELKQHIQDSIIEMPVKELSIMKSRIIHVNSRLSRIANSPTYNQAALEYLQIGTSLLDLVIKLLADPSKLDESIQTLGNLTISAPSEIESEVDEANRGEQKEFKNQTSKSPLTKPEDSSSPIAHSSKMFPSQEVMAALANSPKSSELFNLLEQINQLAKPPPKLPVHRRETSDSDEESYDSNQCSRTLRKPRSKSTLSSGPHHPKVRFSKVETKTSTSSANISDSNQLSTDELLKIIQGRFNKLGTPFIESEQQKASSYFPKPQLFNFNPSVPPSSTSFTAYQTPTISTSQSFTPNHSTVPVTPLPTLPISSPNDFHPLPFNKFRPDTWNLKFSGSKKDNVSIDRFLKRVERMALRYQISQNRLVDDLSFLLDGDAKEWYWTYLEKMGYVTWVQLKAELIRRFQIRKSDDDVYIDMSTRKQDYPKESFYDFYFAILQMSMQLRVPMPDHELIRFLKANMRPGLHLALGNQLSQIHAIDQLVLRCVEFEDLWTKFGYSPESALSPPSRVVNELSCSAPVIDPDSASAIDINEIRFNQNGYRPPVPRYADYSNKNSIKPSTSSTDVICYSCNQHGHYANNCPASKKKSADESGLCLNCNFKLGNVKSESRPSNASLPQKPTTSEISNQADGVVINPKTSS